jgi:16S rRNA processing protein RimM
VKDSKPAAVEGWVHIARLIRPQGRRGEVLAEILSDFPDRFANLRNAFLWRADKHPVTPILLEQSWLHKGKVVLKFAEVDSISAAEALRGAELVVSADDRMPLQLDQVYISDLIGCECLDVAEDSSTRHLLGTIKDVLRQERTADLLLVARPDGTEYEIPFAKAYVIQVDIAARRVEMRLPPGLLEVNAPLTDEERRARDSSAEPEF